MMGVSGLLGLPKERGFLKGLDFLIVVVVVYFHLGFEWQLIGWGD
jgi:hypothetical protein